MNVVGKNIKKLRISQGMTQEELAEKMFVTRQTISNWENGKSQPDLETLSNMSSLFAVDPSVLIYGVKKAYPRFQKKYVIVAAISLCIVILTVILEFTLYPKLVDNFLFMYYGAFELTLYSMAVRSLGFLALGVFLVSLFSLWVDTRLEKNVRIVILIIGILLLVFSLWLLIELILIYRAPQVFPGFILFSSVFNSQYLRTVFIVVLPLLAGVGLFLGWKRK